MTFATGAVAPSPPSHLAVRLARTVHQVGWILPMFARAVLAVTAAAMLSACTSAETSVTAPTETASRCEVHATTSASTFTATGGSGTVAVSTARDCTWTVTTDSTWVAINGERSGQGEASIGYSVAANPVPAPRSAAISVGASSIALSQAAAPCRFSLSRSGDAIGSGGGRLGFDVSTLSGCSWTAVPSQSWIAIASGQSGSASAAVGLTIAANAGARRVGSVNVGSESYTVTQDAVPPPPEPTPAPQPPAPAPAPTPPTPSPAPGPAPKPSPTPPPPPPPRDVHLDGKASQVTGGCPSISFFVDGEHVVADGSTAYKKGNCGDVRNGRGVKVDGSKSSDLVHATLIELEK